MYYYDFMAKAVEETIEQAENGLYYLAPDFRLRLETENLTPARIEDVEMNWDGIKEYLKLEVQKRNTMEDKKPAVINWIHQLITMTIEPAMLEEETEMIKNVVEYMRLKNKEQE